MPWAGLVLGTIGYFLAHQIGSDATFQNCRTGSPGMVILGTVVALAFIGAGALGSWRVHAASADNQARRVIAIVSLLACALYATGVLLPLIAALVIPRCWA